MRHFTGVAFFRRISVVKLLTVSEAAELLKLNPMTVYRMVRAGQLPAVRFGRTVRIDQEQLERKVLGETRQPIPAA